jgi:hypothetical protein
MSSAVYIGKLDDVSVAEILRNLHGNRASGILDLQRDKEQRRIYLADGEVKTAMGNQSGHKLGQFLLAQGRIDAEALEAAVRDVMHGNRLGQKLVNMGKMSTDQLDEALRDLVRTIIQEAMGWFSGLFRFTFKDSPVPYDIALRMSTVSLIFQGTLSYASPTFVQTRLPLHAVLKPSPNIQDVFRDLSCTPYQTYLLTQVNGSRSVDDILSSASGNPDENLVILYAFTAAGLLTTGEQDKQLPAVEFFGRFQDRATGALAKPSGTKKRRRIKWIRPKVAQAALSADDVRKIRDKIQRTYSGLQRISYYEIMDCPPRATQREIHYAFMALCLYYDPDIADAMPEFTDLKGMMEAIYDRMEEAYLTLVDVRKRADYDRQWARLNY